MGRKTETQGPNRPEMAQISRWYIAPPPENLARVPPFPSLTPIKKFAAAAPFFPPAPTDASLEARFECGGGGKATDDEGPLHAAASATTMTS